jgi:hypothetical protein
MTKAFDLALFVPVPANLNDGVVVSSVGPPFATTFKPLVVGAKSGVIVGDSMPAATAPDQMLLSGAGPGYAWGLALNPAAAASVPPATAQHQMLMADAANAWQTTTIAVVMGLGGACMLATGGNFSAAAKLTFSTTATPTVCIDGGDPNLSIIDNFSWDAGTF